MTKAIFGDEGKRIAQRAERRTDAGATVVNCGGKRSWPNMNNWVVSISERAKEHQIQVHL